MSEDLFVIPVIAFLIVVFVCAYYSRKYEKMRWNNGICDICGTPFERFDTDSQGGRGYVCEHHHYIWVSWPKVDQ